MAVEDTQFLQESTDQPRKWNQTTGDGWSQDDAPYGVSTSWEEPANFGKADNTGKRD